jgi:hypothetical protein
MAALTGEELLAKVEALKAEGANKTRLARETGYVSLKSDGGERVNFTGFYEALLQAQGTLAAGPAKPVGRGKPLSYRVTALKGSGNAVINGRYLEQIGVTEGQAVEIHVGRGRLTLVPAA